MKAHLYTTLGGGQEPVQERELSVRPDDGVEQEVCNLYPQVTYQTFQGFGGALTDASGYIFAQMNPQQQKQLLETYFSAAGLRYTQARIHMDSCDFSHKMYQAVSDPDDEELTTFSFADTEAYILPLLDAAEKTAGKRLELMLTPWSPPPFMKSNGERCHGGKLLKQYYRRWARYICRYIRAFTERGYLVRRISVQNEPKATQTWDSCVFTPEEEKELLRDHLYGELQKQGFGHIEIFVWDHNKERVYERAAALIDADTDKMITGVAFHWYSGDHFEALDMIRERYPDKTLILSESCLEYCKYGNAETVENAYRLSHDMIGNLNHGMNGFYDWNILLNEQGGPNHVGNFCDAPFLFDTGNKVLHARNTVRYYWHFCHFIQPGAVRVAHTRYTDALDLTAWKNPDGTLAAVFLNRGDKTLPCKLRVSDRLISWDIPAGSIHTMVLEGEEIQA